MDFQREPAPSMSVDEMRADLAELAEAERIRASEPRHSPEWDEAVHAEEVVRERILGWVDPTGR